MTALVLIPGMMCDERIFNPQIKELGKYYEVSIADISKHSNMTDLASRCLK